MKTNTVTMTGKPVVLTQGPNVIKGQKLTVDLVTGVSKIEGGGWRASSSPQRQAARGQRPCPAAPLILTGQPEAGPADPAHSYTRRIVAAPLNSARPDFCMLQ